MYPILLVFVVGMAITIKRWFQLNRVRAQIVDSLDMVSVKAVNIIYNSANSELTYPERAAVPDTATGCDIVLNTKVGHLARLLKSLTYPIRECGKSEKKAWIASISCNNSQSAS